MDPVTFRSNAANRLTAVVYWFATVAYAVQGIGQLNQPGPGIGPVYLFVGILFFAVAFIQTWKIFNCRIEIDATSLTSHSFFGTRQIPLNGAVLNQNSKGTVQAKGDWILHPVEGRDFNISATDCFSPDIIAHLKERIGPEFRDQ